MIIELREMQRKLQFDYKKMKKLVIPLLAVGDLLRFPNNPIILSHIPGATNPADVLIEPIDLKILVSRFMVNVCFVQLQGGFPIRFRGPRR